MYVLYPLVGCLFKHRYVVASLVELDFYFDAVLCFAIISFLLLIFVAKINLFYSLITYSKIVLKSIFTEWSCCDYNIPISILTHNETKRNEKKTYHDDGYCMNRHVFVEINAGIPQIFMLQTWWVSISKNSNKTCWVPICFWYVSVFYSSNALIKIRFLIFRTIENAIIFFSKIKWLMSLKLLTFSGYLHHQFIIWSFSLSSHSPVPSITMRRCQKIKIKTIPLFCACCLE